LATTLAPVIEGLGEAAVAALSGAFVLAGVSAPLVVCGVVAASGAAAPLDTADMMSVMACRSCAVMIEK
jgi:hypothetical protein